MSKEIEDLLSRHKALKAERRHWEQHWQELAEVMLPRRAEFTTTPVPGEKRTSQIYDGTPMQARRSLPDLEPLVCRGSLLQRGQR